jgi:hypothetical protein
VNGGFGNGGDGNLVMVVMVVVNYGFGLLEEMEW